MGNEQKRERVTIPYLRKKKAEKSPISMLTAYDYPMALLEDAAGIDIILVGDSLGMTVLGFDSTLPVKMDTMIDHAQAVRRGAPNVFLVGDMPYMSYQVSTEEAVRNAGRFMKEAAVDCIKLEGGRNVVHTIEAIVNATIPVMGHLGLTPQSTSMLGGFTAQGRDVEGALEVIEDAKMLEEAGVCALLLEAIPPEVATYIAENASIPVISLGAGGGCDGCCLIVHDILGFFDRFVPRFVKQYANVNKTIGDALKQYVSDVNDRTYPEPKHTYGMRKGEAEKLLEALRQRDQ